MLLLLRMALLGQSENTHWHSVECATKRVLLFQRIYASLTHSVYIHSYSAQQQRAPWHVVSYPLIRQPE
eukprot:13782-Heterococcus_DN1.PRE.1